MMVDIRVARVAYTKPCLFEALKIYVNLVVIIGLQLWTKHCSLKGMKLYNTPIIVTSNWIISALGPDIGAKSFDGNGECDVWGCVI